MARHGRSRYGLADADGLPDMGHRNRHQLDARVHGQPLAGQPAPDGAQRTCRASLGDDRRAFCRAVAGVGLRHGCRHQYRQPRDHSSRKCDDLGVPAYVAGDSRGTDARRHHGCGPVLSIDVSVFGGVQCQ